MSCEETIDPNDSTEVKARKKKLNETCKEIAKIKRLQEAQGRLKTAKKSLIACKERESKNPEVTCGLYEGNKINEEKSLKRVKKNNKTNPKRLNSLEKRVKKIKGLLKKKLKF